MKILITGNSGYIGSHLIKALHQNDNYELHGLDKNYPKIEVNKFILQNITGENHWDVDEYDCVIHLAAEVSVSRSVHNPIHYYQTNTIGTLNVLKNVKTKMFLHASTGSAGPMNNPYGISKYYGHQMVNYYREQYGIFSCSGILFNHESNRRPHNFVTRKVTSTAAKIKLGFENQLVLGNLNVERDWIHARDAVNAMWFMLQTDSPSDYVIASGNSRSVSDFCKTAFEYLGLNYKDYVVSSDKFIRSMESFNLVGCAKKINNIGWLPKTSFETMVNDMVENDYNLLSPFKFKK